MSKAKWFYLIEDAIKVKEIAEGYNQSSPLELIRNLEQQIQNVQADYGEVEAERDQLEIDLATANRIVSGQDDVIERLHAARKAAEKQTTDAMTLIVEAEDLVEESAEWLKNRHHPPCSEPDCSCCRMMLAERVAWLQKVSGLPCVEDYADTLDQSTDTDEDLMSGCPTCGVVLPEWDDKSTEQTEVACGKSVTGWLRCVLPKGHDDQCSDVKKNC